MCSIFSVYACVNTHIIKNRFSASISENEAELAKVAFCLLGIMLCLERGGGGGVNESEHKLGGISGSC